MKRRTTAAILLSGILLTSAADAQQQRRYDEWRDPNQPSAAEKQAEHTEALIMELRELIRIGRRDRAASPRFLDDLEDALSTHRRAQQQVRANPAPQPEPEPERIADFNDDFSDGDFTRGLKWQVARGEFFVTRRGRLASFVELPRQSTGGNNQNEAVIKLFGKLLGANTQQQQSSNGEPVSNEAAAIFLAKDISNAFDMRMRLASDSRAGGTLEIGVFQGNDGRNGYRVQFTEEGRVKLLRVGRTVKVLQEEAFTFPPLAQDRRPGTYDVRWLRSRRGRMQVFIDGREAIDIADLGFRDDFDGFRMVNAEGRHGMDAIRVKMLN